MSDTVVRGPSRIRLAAAACALLVLGAACPRDASAGEALPPEAARALAEMRFGLARLALEKAGADPDRLDAADACAEAFDAACRNLERGKWKPKAKTLLGMNGKIGDASRSGISFRSSGVSMVLPWKSLKPLARQRFLEGASKRPNARIWLARVAYAVWSGLGPRAKEEFDAASKSGAKLPGWLARDVERLAKEAAARAKPKRKPNGNSASKPNGKREPKSRSGGKGLLGSADFRPSPERPVGWRGDGTGRFPGATPPLEWYRRAKGAGALACRAGKPSGPPKKLGPAPATPLDEWLVLGPFERASGEAALADAIIPDEASAQPDAGDRAAGAAWRALPAQGHHVSFAELFGTADRWNPEPWKVPSPVKVAYAHTYLFSDRDAEGRLHVHGMNGVKCWVNGEVVVEEPKREGVFEQKKVALRRGWNRVLLKVWGYERNWGASVWAAVPPTGAVEYQTKNVLWMTPIPRGAGSPVVVGDRIFVGADTAMLICIDKRTGRMLWLRSHNFYDVADEKDRASVRAQAEPIAAKLREMDEEVVKRTNAAVSPAGLPHGRAAVDDGFWRRRWDVEKDLVAIMRGVDRKKYFAQRVDWEFASATPTSDGESVYMYFSNRMAVCYDLDGRRRWATVEPTEDAGPAHHGRHASPLLAGGVLVTQYGGRVQAFDVKAGKVLWSQKAGRARGSIDYGSPVAAKYAGRDVAVICHGHGMLFADGSTAWAPWGGYVGENSSVVVERDSLFLWDRAGIIHARMPPSLGGGLKKANAYAFPSQSCDYPVASPLLFSGLLYCVNDRGTLRVFDPGRGELVHERRLVLRPHIAYVSNPGIASSPAAAGGHVFITDNQGNTLVVEPGRDFRRVALNSLEDFIPNSTVHQQTISNLAFDGNRIYVRSQKYLYCIGDQRAGTASAGR